MEAMGATVFARVSWMMLGESLHRLEYHADIAVIDRISDPRTAMDALILRSDRFPAWWEGIEVVLKAQYGALGFEDFEPVLSCPLNRPVMFNELFGLK